MLFSLRFSADSVVLLTNNSGLDKDCTDKLLATTPLGIGAAFSLGGVFPVEAEMQTAQCSFGSHSVTSGELQKSLTRPDVEVKFSNNVTFKIPFIEGEGQILVTSLRQWLVKKVGIGRVGVR